MKSVRLDTPKAPSAAELVAALPSALLIVGPNGAIESANAAAEAFFNISESHLIGRAFELLIDLPKRFAGVTDVPFVAYDVDVNIRHGGALRVDIASTPFPDRPGWRMVVLHREAVSQRFGQFRGRTRPQAAASMAVMLAHEIKNPLSGIRGAAQLLETQLPDPNGAAMTRLIRDEVDRIAALIDQMQGLTDTRPRERTAENIYAVLDHVRRIAENGFARHVTIADDYDPSLPPVFVDRDGLIQVLINLLKNAAEAVPTSGGQIWLTTAYRHGVTVSTGQGTRRLALPIELCVIDNGPGPPTEIVESLFEPFVSSKARGRGLGLALSDKLMRDMGGTIQFAREGRPERSVFRLMLPRAGGRA